MVEQPERDHQISASRELGLRDVGAREFGAVRRVATASLFDELGDQIDTEVASGEAARAQEAEQITEAATDIDDTVEAVAEAVDHRGKPDPLAALGPAERALVVAKSRIALAVAGHRRVSIVLVHDSPNSVAAVPPIRARR